MNFFQEVIEWIKQTKPDKQKLAKKKLELCRKHGMKHIPTDIEIYLNASQEDLPLIREFLQTKPVRTGSGVAVVATMTKPDMCPHGGCTYCPGGIGSFFGDTPKSYTGKEPSTMRGKRNDYDSYRIVFNRLEQYIVLGQNPDKVEQIIMGGTFPALPKNYQEEFIYYSFKAYNDFSNRFFPKGRLDLKEFKTFFELPGDINDKQRFESIKKKVIELKNNNKKTLEEEQTLNEKSAIRCIGLTIETKPDWGYKEHGLELLRLGTTRIELGVQTTYDEILKHINRGHTLEDTKKSIADLRDLGFKLNFHVMPGLPTPTGERISREKDLESLKTIFTDPAFKPDMLKIYPCMVMPGTKLEKDFKSGKFKPLSTEEAAEIILETKKFVPEYCRIMRIQRDIPTYATTAGVDRTNLRQYVENLAKEKGVKCRCIRCREVGKQEIKTKPEIRVQEYEASSGKEFFISMEADDKLLGFLRLRLPPRSLHPAITKDSALIRELHVYGTAVSIGDAEQDKTQHKGFGKQLMQKAEDNAKQQGKNKIVIISGVGVRDYYRSLGYKREDCYMTKQL